MKRFHWLQCMGLWSICLFTELERGDAFCKNIRLRSVGPLLLGTCNYREQRTALVHQVL